MERLLGQGGMGPYGSGGTPVSIAACRDQVSSSRLHGKKTLVHRFLNEARIAAGLRSDYVVRVMDVGQLDSGLPYLVMEWLEGVDLCGVLDREGPLEARRAIDYALQVLPKRSRKRTRTASFIATSSRRICFSP